MSRLKQDIAVAQLRAALLNLIDTHDTEPLPADSVTVNLSLDDGTFCEGDFTIFTHANTHGGAMPVTGGSL